MSAMRPMREGDLMKGYFAQVRRAGFDSGISAGKLSRAMMEVLSQLPREAPPSKDVVVQHLGLLGQMSKIRDIDAAWNNAKRQIVRERPERFCLDGKVLRRASETEERPREQLSGPVSASSPPWPNDKG